MPYIYPVWSAVAVMLQGENMSPFCLVCSVNLGNKRVLSGPMCLINSALQSLLEQKSADGYLHQRLMITMRTCWRCLLTYTRSRFPHRYPASWSTLQSGPDNWSSSPLASNPSLPFSHPLWSLTSSQPTTEISVHFSCWPLVLLSFCSASPTWGSVPHQPSLPFRPNSLYKCSLTYPVVSLYNSCQMEPL